MVVSGLEEFEIERVKSRTDSNFGQYESLERYDLHYLQVIMSPGMNFPSIHYANIERASPQRKIHQQRT